MNMLKTLSRKSSLAIIQYMRSFYLIYWRGLFTYLLQRHIFCKEIIWKRQVYHPQSIKKQKLNILMFLLYVCHISYKQVVWADTEYLGCAEQKCQAGTLVVCNYGPG